MRSSLDYTGLAQLCGRSPIIRKIMLTHNRIIPPSLRMSYDGVETQDVKVVCRLLGCRPILEHGAAVVCRT